MKFIILISLIPIFLESGLNVIYAQDVNEYQILEYLQQKRHGEGELNIIMDDLVLENLRQHILYNAKNPSVSGYRIRIFSDSGFDSYEGALNKRTQFIKIYENISAYLQYDVPNYKVYVGDCRTKSEALKILELIRKDFPYAFIVPQNINLQKE